MAETLISTGNRYVSLPERYKRPVLERPNLSQVVEEEIPVIDLGCSDRAEIVRQIGEACRLYGFFQVINHGISGASMQEIIGITRGFHQPMEEKMKLYSDDPAKKIKQSTSFNVKKETVHNWRLDSYRIEFSKYRTVIRDVGFNLLEYISESLGLEKKYMKEVLGEQRQHMAMNFYPPCSKPELTYGLPGHTDPNSLTIHLQDQEVAGLQVYRAGKWITVDPHPGALVVTIGDQIQALSNNKYKSVSHRAIVNSYKERISMDSFLCPGTGAVIGPTKQVGSEEFSTIYRDFAIPSPLHQL